MTKLDGLRALHDAVKAGEPSIHDLALAAIGRLEWKWVRNAYAGSLDAAHALHRAVLPGWGWCSATDAHDEQWFSVSENSGDYETEEIYAENPARSWLLAILSALIAQEEAA